MNNAFLTARFLLTSLVYLMASGNQRVNIARNKTTHQSSSVYYNGYSWEADFVLDGNVEFSETCKCCSCTSGRETPWLVVDLESSYQIGRIDVVGRPDITYQLRGFELYTGRIQNDTRSLYNNSVTVTEYLNAKGHFIIPVGNVTMQFIKIYNRKLQYNRMSICEIYVFEACEDYQFEPDCSPCHCEGPPCDKITGTCSSGCQAGWQGAACNISCESGKFGTDCEEDCHCLNPSSCDKATGVCLDGYCMFGWKGKYCNISTVISEMKQVKMSSQFSSWKAEGAVDGDTRTEASACVCCAATKYTDAPWFEIDLGNIYRIAYIVVFGRTDFNSFRQSFNGLRIYAGKHSSPNKYLLFSYGETRYFLNVTLDVPVVTQYITLKQTGGKQMVICELQLLEGECDDGQFGRLCDKTCNCQGEACDKETGVCPSGTCLPGFRRITCTEECADGNYGIGCNETCGYCFNSTACNKVNGTCPGCSAGYVGQFCIESCSEASYGMNCSLHCGNCKENENCDHVTGHCKHGCEPGYSGLLCKKSCGTGRFGIDCSQYCGNCAGNQTCNITNGHCGETGCSEGFVEPLCVRTTEELREDEKASLSLGASVGIAVVLVFVLLAVLVVITYKLRKRRRQKPADKEENVLDGDSTNDKNKDDVEFGKRTVTSAGGVPEEIEYYDFAPRKKDIKIHQIWDYIQKGKANDCEQFCKEFEGFKAGLQFECKCAREAQNKSKNRYKEMYAYDDNRVCLKSTDASEGDYINASFIDGYEKVTKFIACQGPTKDMVDDFLRMVLQQHCSVIVMLTNIFELGVQKCLQYWPVDDESLSFGTIVVKLLKEQKSDDFVIRHLEISRNEESQMVKQYHFTSWPDKTIPDTTWSLVNFWRTVRKETIKSTRPVVVHCSAGVGRTGTFIALDNLYTQAVTEGCVRPAQMIETLRRQRVNMVQTKEQYVYLHEALSEALLLGTHFVMTEQFEHMYRFMLETQEGEARTNLEIQFHLIELSLKDSETDVNSGQLAGNEADDTGKADLPVADFTEVDAVYTNVEEAYKTKDDMNEKTKTDKLYLMTNQGEHKLHVERILADSCMSEPFLDVIISCNVETIIHLQESAPGLNTAMKVGHLDIKVLNQTKFENWSRTEFSVENTENDKTRRYVSQYEYYDWKSEENIPKNLTSFLSFLSDVLSQHKESRGEGSVLFTDGSTNRCGIVCVLLNELKRIDKENSVNIIDSVKNIRRLDRGAVSSLAQYRFCYEAILSVVQQNNIYQNVLLQ